MQVYQFVFTTLSCDFTRDHEVRKGATDFLANFCPMLPILSWKAIFHEPLNMHQTLLIRKYSARFENYQRLEGEPT